MHGTVRQHECPTEILCEKKGSENALLTDRVCQLPAGLIPAPCTSSYLRQRFPQRGLHRRDGIRRKAR